ncbi:MAG: SDR family oxidoreductase [Anaerolineaceae bacterium]|nr:SDR family oxidoreductase [Anaerolineaceae bacterium]
MTEDLALGRLNGKVAVVTGVGRLRGIGFGVARKFAREGAALMLTDILDGVEDCAKEIRKFGGQVISFKADLTERAQVAEMVAKTINTFGRIDILCNVAGKSVPPRPSFLEMSDEYWHMVMDRNLLTAYYCCKIILPHMVRQRYGKVVNFSSISGVKYAYRYSAAYAASKGAVSGLTKALALEFGEFNINVNAILPGDIDVSDDAWKPEDGPRDLGSLNAHLRPPISRPGTIDEVADLALFLSTDESAFISGMDMVIDGGVSIVEPYPAGPKD